MERKIDLRRAADELAAYAAQRLADFEQHRPGSAFRQPETRNEGIRDILRGMAEVYGADGGELIARFDQRLETVSGCGCVEPLPLAGQKHAVHSLSRYASALEQLGGDLDPGGVEFMSGLINDEEGVRRTQEFRRLKAEYPERDKWPALCTVYLGGGRQMAIGTVDADELDMKIIQETGDRFLKRPGVTPICTRQLRVPVHEQTRVLKVEPGRLPEEIAIPNTLEAFQAAVDGFCSLSDEDAVHYAREFEHPMPVYGSQDEPTQWVFHVL